ncbi:TetR/AcrR family transcriptional regulator [Alicyclobacillus ferrooxydans]|uniref:TetR/AcrR family transcriptional regulator n=1 Tax=Alicyclobacillus ferrooxydans TaxID=471514 RepID=UPI0006D57919|nr:TetR/AcrR family transcriptional regulator [Alicyclobacillus ferrooxydans]
MRVPMTKAQRHVHILRAAKQLFVERGYDDVTIADVIKASDIARGTFYLHFDSLESLLTALFDEVVFKTWKRIAPILEQVADIETCTIETVRAVFRMFDNTEDSLIDVFSSGGGQEFMKRKEDALYNQLGGLVEQALIKRHHLLHQGQVPEAERNLKWTVVMVVSLVANMSYYSANHISEADRSAFEQHLVSFVLAGMMNHMNGIEEKNATWQIPRTVDR